MYSIDDCFTLKYNTVLYSDLFGKIASYHVTHSKVVTNTIEIIIIFNGTSSLDISVICPLQQLMKNEDE